MTAPDRPYATLSASELDARIASNRAIRMKQKAPPRRDRPTPIAKREMRKCRKALGLPLKGAI